MKPSIGIDASIMEEEGGRGRLYRRVRGRERGRCPAIRANDTDDSDQQSRWGVWNFHARPIGAAPLRGRSVEFGVELGVAENPPRISDTVYVCAQCNLIAVVVG